jgi:hypothetical protein
MTSQIFDPGPILSRVEKLEKQNARLKLALVLFMIPAGCLIFLGAARLRGHTVQARRIELKDGAGVVRAVLGMRSAGPGLTLYDASGQTQEALLTVLPNGPALALYDADGITRVLLGVTPKGATVAFNDSQGKLRAEMGFSGGIPHMTFFDTTKKAVYFAH